MGVSYGRSGALPCPGSAALDAAALLLRCFALALLDHSPSTSRQSVILPSRWWRSLSAEPNHGRYRETIRRSCADPHSDGIPSSSSQTPATAASGVGDSGRLVGFSASCERSNRCRSAVAGLRRWLRRPRHSTVRAAAVGDPHHRTVLPLEGRCCGVKRAYIIRSIIKKGVILLVVVGVGDARRDRVDRDAAGA